MLVKNAYGAYRLNVPVTANDYLEEVTFFRLFVVTVFQSNEPTKKPMTFGSAYTRILEA